MRKLLHLGFATLLSSICLSSTLFADDLLTEDVLTREFEVSHEVLLRGAAGGATPMKQGNRGVASVTSQDAAAKYVASVRFAEGPLFRVGGSWEAFWFQRSNGLRPATPSRLDALSGVFGMDFELFDSWLVRIEAQPGFYGEMGNGSNFDDFNCPFILAATYIYDKDLQLIFGVGIDPWRAFPAFPALGVRWKFSDALVLNMVPPNPRLECYLSDKAMIFAGADLRTGTFRVGPKTGDRGGETKVNNAILSYTEVRLGVGGTYNLTGSIAMELQVGSVILRRFDYERADLTYRASGYAPYGSVALSAKF